MTIEPVKLTASPVLKEQDKVAPELVATTSKIDKKQKATSCVIDFEGGIAILNVKEGEYDGINFCQVGSMQREVDLKDLAAVISNKSAAAIMGVFAQFVLDEGTKVVGK